jgi:hypothetical protein
LWNIDRIDIRKIYPTSYQYNNVGTMTIDDKISNVDYDVTKLWSKYNRRNETEIRKKLLDLFEDTKKEIGEQYVQTLGESLDKVAPIQSGEINLKSKFFWQTANEWDPKIEKNLKSHLDHMKKIFK